MREDQAERIHASGFDQGIVLPKGADLFAQGIRWLGPSGLSLRGQCLCLLDGVKLRGVTKGVPGIFSLGGGGFLVTLTARTLVLQLR